MKDFSSITDFIRSLYPKKDIISLHEPVFYGNERKYVLDAIDSTFVSSVGEYVNRFEAMLCKITGASYSVALVNGTNALHLALLLADVRENDEVICQSLTFIATCNALAYINASPVFIDIDKDTLGMSADSLAAFLDENAELRDDGFAYNIETGRRIKACIPMHTFGMPCKVDLISDICDRYNITLIEDAAESIGSYYKDVHTGVFGKMGIFSFNGNKTITCGGGGAIVTNDEVLAKKAKHLSTQAKVPHKWAFSHDAIGFNYRMPNLNAAMACAQLEQLDEFVKNKRKNADLYRSFFADQPVSYMEEPADCRSNFWLNAIILFDKAERDDFLKYTNDHGIMTRPVWELMHTLPMFENAYRTDLANSEWIAERLVNIPSGVRI